MSLICSVIAKDVQVLSCAKMGNVEIPIYGSVEEPLFKATDVASVLSLTNVTDMVSRIDSEELTKLNLGGRQGETWFLTEGGLYEVLFQSRKPIAKQFKKIVKTILKELRLRGEVSIKSAKQVSSASAKAAIVFIKGAKEFFRLSDASVALLYNKAAASYDLPVQIDYVDSKGTLHSLTELLKSHNIQESARVFNKRLLENGILEQKSRKSHKGIKHFLSLTDKGLAYGENQVSPNNPNETQPKYYDKSFASLIELLNI